MQANTDDSETVDSMTRHSTNLHSTLVRSVIRHLYCRYSEVPGPLVILIVWRITSVTLCVTHYDSVRQLQQHNYQTSPDMMQAHGLWQSTVTDVTADCHISEVFIISITITITIFVFFILGINNPEGSK